MNLFPQGGVGSCLPHWIGVGIEVPYCPLYQCDLSSTSGSIPLQPGLQKQHKIAHISRRHAISINLAKVNNMYHFLHEGVSEYRQIAKVLNGNKFNFPSCNELINCKGCFRSMWFYELAQSLITLFYEI